MHIFDTEKTLHMNGIGHEWGLRMSTLNEIVIAV